MNYFPFDVNELPIDEDAKIIVTEFLERKLLPIGKAGDKKRKNILKYIWRAVFNSRPFAGVLDTPSFAGGLRRISYATVRGKKYQLNLLADQLMPPGKYCVIK